MPGTSNPTETLARFAVETTFGDLPTSAVAAAKRLTLDTLGCTVGGRRVPSSEILGGLKIEAGGEPEATVLVDGARLPCASAAHVNAHYGNALDSEETILHSGHLAACTVPPALTVAEWQKAPGADLVTAIAVGFDVAARIGLSLRHIDVDEDGTVQTAHVAGLSWAAFASTVATGRMLGLDGSEMAAAFGATVALAPLPIAGRWGRLAAPRPMTKYGLYGAMAEAGVTAARLVRAGFEGDRTILDGDHGFWRMMGSRRCEWGVMTDRLGDRWLAEETSFKLYPACQWAIPALDIFYELRAVEGLDAGEIEAVEVLVPEAAIRKFMHEHRVDTVVDGQFSIPHLVALAACAGPPGPDWHTTASLHDPEVAAFASRVTVGTNPEAEGVLRRLIDDKGHAEAIPTAVTITARGRTFRDARAHATGDAWAEGASATDERLREKFIRFCAPALPRDQIGEAIAIVDHLDHEPTVDPLVAALVAPA
jgi:2-methylcitrate dehydratase PrpD